MSAGRTVDSVDDGTILFSDFDSLGISVPLETTKYAFIEMFLSRALNLKNVGDILEPPEASQPQTKKKTKNVEILPQIAVPPDLWLQSQLCIVSIKMKIDILKEVNALLDEALETIQNGELPPLRETSINLLQQQIKAGNFLEFPRSDSEAELRFDSLNEIDEDQTSLEEESPISEKRHTPVLDLRSFSLSSNASSLKSSSRIRMSSFSRDLKSSTRKFSFLALPNSKIGPPDEENKIHTPPQTPPVTLPVSNAPGGLGSSLRDSSYSLANGLLAKSRLYSKIKKRRELATLITSASTNPAIASPTTLSMRRSSAPELPDTRRGSSQISVSRQYGSPKDKHEYYCQLRNLAARTREMIKFLNQRNQNSSLVQLMEFIKTLVFKFVIIDVSHMIIEYGHLQVLDPQ